MTSIQQGIKSLDFNTRVDIVSFLDRSDIESFSQQNKDCAYCCAFIYRQPYAECITNNHSVPAYVISVLKRVVRPKEVKEIAASIVEKIFKTSGIIMFCTQLCPLLKDMMTEYYIDNLDQKLIYDTMRYSK